MESLAAFLNNDLSNVDLSNLITNKFDTTIYKSNQNTKWPVACYNELKYTIYDWTAINDDFETIKKYKIAMFGDIKVIQYVKMIPKIDIEGAKDNGN